jgi:cellulose synthase/poly-beta-1,6-N-acetylglucosamine synthase-like glycosyltransferase
VVMALLRWVYVAALVLAVSYALWQGYALLLWALVEAIALLLPMLMTLGARARVPGARSSPMTCVVVIPAFNEEASIAQTLAHVQSQGLSGLRIVVVDDASTDSTATIVGAIVNEDARVSLMQVARGGKAKALNHALADAKEDVFVTLDADTLLQPGALEALTQDVSSSPAVEAASGFISVARPTSLLALLQSIEYARASMLRVGFSKLRMHEQAPGAFTAFRTRALQAVGGFPDSLTEDYEVIFRLYERARTEGRKIQVVGSHTAFAVTSVPTTLGGFFLQRQRWFAGFLMTLYRYRSMLFDPRLGVFGMIRLPTKVFDTAAPLVLLLSCVALAVRSAALPSVTLVPTALGAAMSLGLALLGALLAQRVRRTLPWYAWLGLPLEVGYSLVRALAVLGAYPMALRAQASQWNPRR